MSTYNWLIVGLGNPGSKYAGNRHNIGWMAAEDFAKKHKGEIAESSSIYHTAEIKYARQTALIAFPTTYMNRSGEAVIKLANKHGISPNNIIVLVDEYNFPLGKVHIKSGGSDGGHNGIASIIEELGTPNFIRLRLGIDRKFGMGELVDYVLSDFSSDEKEALDLTLSKAVDSMECVLKSGLQRAMSQINSESLWKPKEDKPKPSEESLQNTQLG